MNLFCNRSVNPLIRTLILGIITLLTLPTPAIQLHSSKSGNLPFRYNTIPLDVYAKEPALVYLTVDTSEPFMKIAIDKEVFQLRRNCESPNPLSAVVIIGSQLGRQLNQSAKLTVDACLQKRWQKFELQDGTQHFIKEQIKAYRGALSQQEIQNNPLSLEPVLEEVMNEVFQRFLQPEKFAFFFQIKSHGNGANGIDFFSQASQQVKINDQIAMLGLTQDFYASVYETYSDFGAGQLLGLYDRFIKSGGHLGLYQNNKLNKAYARALSLSTPADQTHLSQMGVSGLGRQEGMHTPGSGSNQSTSSQTISQEQLAHLFGRFRAQGVDSLFVYQESCNSTLYHSPNPKDRFPIMDSVYNYYRASGLLGYHNLNWQYLAEDHKLPSELLYALMKKVGTIDNKFPDDDVLDEMYVKLWDKDISKIPPLIEALDDDLLRNFVFHKDLIRILNYFTREDRAYREMHGVIDLVLKKAFDKVNFTLMPESEKKYLFGHLLNPFYFNNDPFYFLQNRAHGKLSEPVKPENMADWHKYHEVDQNSIAYRQIMNYLLAKMGTKNLNEIKLRDASGALIPVHHFWIKDIDTFFLTSYHELLSILQTPLNSALDLGLFLSVCETYNIPTDFQLNKLNRPVLFATQKENPKSGSILIRNGDRWTTEHNTWDWIPKTFGGYMKIEAFDKLTHPFLGKYIGAKSKLTRFLRQGKIDTSFGPSKKGEVIHKVTNYEIETPIGVVVQKDGRSVILTQLLGGTNSLNAQNGFALFRVNTDGSLDSSFAEGHGSALIERTVGIMTFGANEMLFPNRITKDKNDNLYVTVLVATQSSSSPACQIFKFDADGMPALDFGENGKLEVSNPAELFGPLGAQFVPMEGGKFLISGWYSNLGVERNLTEMLNLYLSKGTKEDSGAIISFYENPKLRLLRYNADGSPDLSFGPNEQSWVELANALDMAGATINVNINKNGATSDITGRLSKDIDSNMDTIITEQTDGKYLVMAGAVKDGERAVMVTRLNHDGSLDTTFGE